METLTTVPEIKRKLFVLDTSVILHGYRSYLSFKKNDVAITIEALSELDNFKVGTNEINHSARECIRSLSKLSHIELFNGGASLGKGLGKRKLIKI